MLSNEGAASPLSRWCSHSRPITHSNNLFSALVMHHIMIIGCIAERCRHDVLALLTTLCGLPYFGLLFVFCFFVIPIWVICNSILVIALILNEIFSLVEKTLYCSVFVITLFSLMNFTRMTSIYCTFFHFVEAVIGKIWHDSTICLVTPTRQCKTCKSKGCKPGKCYTFVEGLIYDHVNINCQCFRNHIANRIALARERDAGKTLFQQTIRITACKYLWRSSELKKYCRDGCGKFDDDVLERCYDMERYMWISVRLESSETPSQSPNSSMDNIWNSNREKLVTFKTSRDDLDEIATVHIDNPDRLFAMPELRYAFLKNRARVESDGDIIYTPVRVLKRLLMLAIALLQVFYASKTYKDDSKLGLSIILSSCVLQFLYSLRDCVTINELGGPDSRVARMLAVDSMSVGLNLIRYSNEDTSWTRHNGFGSMFVGKTDVLENILHNRTIVMEKNAVSLSREGTGLFIADVKLKQSTPGSSVRISEWRKADVSEIPVITSTPLLNLDVEISG